MKQINLSKKQIDNINLSKFDKYLMPKYKISHQEGGYGFYDKSGIEHYHLLAYLSTLYDNETILDIGTFQGGSAFALSYNPNNKVVSVDIKYQVTTPVKELTNIEFLVGDILNAELGLKDSSTPTIPTSGLFSEDNKVVNGHDLIQSSNFILYDTVHNGIVELEFHKHLIKSNWQGICLWDDIKYRWNREIREGMQTFWKSIDEDRKIDLTDYGHWTGTGLVWYGDVKPEINLI